MAKFISDNDMAALEASAPTKKRFISDDEMDSISSSQAKDAPAPLDLSPEKLGPKIAKTVQPYLEKFDAYTGAPTRAALSAGLKGENPLQAFGKQFGKPAGEAPTGKQIASEQLGLGTTGSLYPGGPDILPVSPAGAVGLGIDVIADPTNLVGPLNAAGTLAHGAVPMLGMAAKGAGKAVKGAGKAAAAIEAATIGTKGLESAAETLTKAGNVIGDFIKPTIAKDYDKSFKMAKELGLDTKKLPEAVEFGPDSFIARNARVIREGPLGETPRNEFRDYQSKVYDAIKNKVTEKTGARRVIADVDVGNELSSKYNTAVDKAFDADAITNKKVIEKNPGLELDEDAMGAFNAKLDELEAQANQLAEYGVGDEQSAANQTLKAIEGLRKSPPTYKDLYDRSRALGRTAFKKGPAAVPADKKALADIYFAATDALEGTVNSKLGSDAAKGLIDSNKKVTQLIKDKGVLENIAGNGPPEQAMKRVFSDSKRVKALERILEPQDFADLRNSFIQNEVFKYSPEGFLQPGSSLGSFRKNKALLAQYLDDNQVNDIEALLEFAAKTGPIDMSSSATGASNRFAEFFKSALDHTLGAFQSVKTNEVLKEIARGEKPLTMFADDKLITKPLEKVKGNVKSMVEEIPSRILGGENGKKLRPSKAIQLGSTQAENIIDEDKKKREEAVKNRIKNR